MAVLYHVTPYANWTKSIRRRGLIPGGIRRGMYADGKEARIYLFEDENTAEDGLANWLIDEFPKVKWFALLEVDVPDDWVHDDPEIAGSYYIEHPVPVEGLRLVRKMEA